MGANSGDEWWRHDESDALGASRNSSQNSQDPTPISSQNAPGTDQYGQSHYALSGEKIAPWREKDPTGHLDALRTKRNSRARKSSRSQYSSGGSYRSGRTGSYSGSYSSGQSRRSFSDREPGASPSNQEMPQFRDRIARNGGWDVPSLTDRLMPQIPPAVYIVVAVLALILVIVLLRGVVGCVSSAFAPQEEPAATEDANTDAQTDESAITGVAASADTSGVSYTLLDEGRTTASGDGRMSFSAVGDNLMNSNLLDLADSWAGSTGDDEYDFSPFYTEISSYIQNQCDVSFINQETTLGGTDNFGYMGYPSYNSPDSLADAVESAGWRIVNLDTNHTYDTWTDSIEHAQSVWAQKTKLVTIGSYTSESDRSTIRVVECNGIRLAMLAYCYGQNGYEQSDLPNDYYAVPYDEDRMISEVANAREVADVVVVYMHWGDEYDNDVTETQSSIAQVCADNGVDMVIGSHAHVIQPVEWIERSDGKKMLCVYGLGDFVSGYSDTSAGYSSYPEVILSGMITCDFVRVEDTSAENVGPGGIAIENVVWHPLIEHMEGDSDTVRFIKNYTDEEAQANELLSSLDDPRGWLVEETERVIGDTITIDI